MIPYVVLEVGDDAAANRTAVRNDNVKWCRFNNETVFWQAPGQGERLPSGLQKLGGTPKSSLGELYLVVQAGNAFLAEFPESRVLVNKGRYLAVDLTLEELARVQEHGETCFGIRRLPEDAAVVTTLAPTRRAADPSIARLVSQVDVPALTGTLTGLVGFRTRHSLSAEFSAAADRMESELETLGFSVARTAISVGAATSFNVIADRTGTAADRRLVIATAHLDSVNIAGGFSADAPGADDNGSGSAGILEIARIFSGKALAHDLRLILFGGEEQGLHGSQQYVAALSQAERDRIDSVINMDMIGCVNMQPMTVMLEGAAVSQALMNDLADAAHDYTSLAVQTSLNPFASDHVPFINAGLPCLLTIEGADTANHDIHTANDTLGKIDFGLTAEILKMNIAVMARRLGVPEATDAPRPSSSPVVA
ncbi:MAG TPA: M28 family metallopeptidase [Paracoccus sp. (in: a-proteobacteria)]|nr:M28 family metallopeptidase [Paracoccus sp. (in: a-proteobacteria)]